MTTRYRPASYDEIISALEDCGPTIDDNLRWFTAPSTTWFRVLQETPEAAVWVARVKLLPEEIMDHLARHEEEEVRFGIAMSGKLSSFPDIKQLLHNDPVRRIRIAAGAYDETE